MNALTSRKSKGEVTFDCVNIVVMIIICFLTLYPIWFTIVNSFNDGMDGARGGIYWWPRIFTLDNYTTVFRDGQIIKAFGITIGRTFFATTLHVFFTAMVAYALSKRELVGRKIYLTIIMITMFFGGGLIPYYLVLRDLHLIDNFLVFVIPGIFSAFNMIIFQSFFRELPAGLEEAAMIDGCGEFKIFWKIIIPLSGPVLATIALFVGVGNWNDYFSGVIFINNQDLQPVQTYLYKLIAIVSASAGSSRFANANVNPVQVTAESVKLATMVIATAPIVCVYPFLQKYFVKGMLIGSIKG